MINGLPAYINVAFVFSTLLTVYLFYKATNKSKSVLIIILCWLVVQGVISLSLFYLETNSVPPRFLLLPLPPILLIIILFLTRQGKQFIDSLDLKSLTSVHTVRIPVELALLWLFQQGKVPQLMTFEGRNFDILSGITAPFIAYFFFSKHSIGKKGLLVWNIICLALLMNIVVNAMLSAPFSFQQFAFDQPNIAVLYFPFTWLPCCVVPLVLLSHLAAIRQLTGANRGA